MPLQPFCERHPIRVRRASTRAKDNELPRVVTATSTHQACPFDPVDDQLIPELVQLIADDTLGNPKSNFESELAELKPAQLLSEALLHTPIIPQPIVGIRVSLRARWLHRRSRKSTVPTACRPPTTTSIKPPVTISDEPLVAGSSPVESPIGHANVVWIIRWQSRQARDADLPRAFASDEWKAVLAEHPDRGGYLQSTSRFMAGGSCCSLAVAGMLPADGVRCLPGFVTYPRRDLPALVR